jgi:MerR family transcriptional regulator, light-induced transcriptional regulator
MSPGPIVGVRVGELARRVGVAPETLRAWERRYGVLRPGRTSGGYRVYGSADERRARRMRELIESGWAAGEAAHAVTAAVEAESAQRTDGAAHELLSALLRFDAPGAHAAFDRLLGARSLDAALRDMILPMLRQVGDGWERGEVSVAQEHFATELITGRLRGLGREWGSGLGPRAVLACPSGERHDIGLLCCALALDRRGWRITYLGADTPVDALATAVDQLDPEVVVIGAVQVAPLQAVAPALGRLAGRVPIALGGCGACADLAATARAQHLPGDPVSGAGELTAAVARTAAG